MKSIIVTLYEGHYHLGVAALANSLYSNGFRGDFYIGYKGEIPAWASAAKYNESLNWEGAMTYSPGLDMNLHFLPVQTESHFTNYKPEFILKIWDHFADLTSANGIFYFDPDIVIKCNWTFFEQWITYGIALVHEVVWNDMPATHPKRHQWAAVAKSLGYTKNNTNTTSYINAGFVGVSRERLGFVKLWVDLINIAVKEFNFDKSRFAQSLSNTDLFVVGDQDLLNVAVMYTDEPISDVGPEGMDFISGGWIMSHATGTDRKPWKINFFKEFIKGNNPSIQSKFYWFYANGMIKSYSTSHLKRKLFYLKLYSFLSRFYKK